MPRQTSKGKCSLCGGAFSKAAMTKHLESCRAGTGASGTQGRTRGPGTKKTFHLIVEGRHLPEYWMHIEIPVSADFGLLDSFLRQTWLECCGHMSAFTVGRKRYSVGPMEEFAEKGMDVALGEVLRPGMKFYHEYDFGSTTVVALKVVSEGEGEVGKELVRLLARNDPPSITCGSCGETATKVCTQCIYEGEGWLCDRCARKHRCGEEMLLPVVNSPRVGVCGYAG